MPTLDIEQSHRLCGRLVIAGIDEAGRGPLAGPVTAGAAILPPEYAHALLNDSKKLTAHQREKIYHELRADTRVLLGSGRAEVEEIDALNILRATHLAMRRAVEDLPVHPDFCLIDGLPVRAFAWPHQGVVKGDGLSLSIAAASIVAKVERDKLMEAAEVAWPGYGFAQHKGYGTAAHLAALDKLGPCPLHRRSFAPVAKFFDATELKLL